MESIETVMVLFVVGLALFLFGWVKYRERRRLLRTGIRAKGVVFQVINNGNSSSTTYYPVVRFLTAANDWVTEKYRTGGNRWTYKEGDTVNVVYDPLNPGRFILDDTRLKNTAPGFIFGGVLLIIISVGLLVLGLRG